ncbi:hypothetical protein ACQ4PT_063636 [Festuca glaucescens]
MNKDNDRRSRLRLPQVSGVVQETSTSAAAAAAPNACAAKNSTVDPSRNAAPKPAPARRFKFRQLNFAQFAIDQIIAEVKKMGVKKKSVCCCLHHLVILYLDSLVVDEPVATDEECPIRAASWNDKLIQIVMHKDSKGNGEFGKLRKLTSMSFLMPPSRVLEESNPILPDPAKASTTIADETTNMQKQNKHVTACADARAQANVDVPVAANHKMPTARPPKANQLHPASSRGTEHQQIPQVMPHCGVPPSKVIQAPQKHAPLPQGIPANREATCPTRESCPPPEPKIKNLDEVTRKRAMLARSPDAPSFDLGFDSPAKFGTDPSYSCGITPVDLDAECFGSEEDDWDETTWKEACDAVDKVEREKGYRQEQPSTDNSFVVPGSGFKTPVGTVNNIVSNSQAEGSTIAAEKPEEKRRRLIRQAICQLSPYITYEDNSLFTCSAEVKELYNAVIAHGRRSTRGKEIDKSPILVNYERFFVSLKELANAMMPCGVVSNTVMELGIESIMLRKDRNVKKIVMPLRVTHLLKDLKRNEKELKKHFNKATAYLDRKDSVSDTIFTASKVGSVMLPVLEDLAPNANEPVNHYWLFVINIRDRRFEVLDSIRSLSDRKLAQNVEDILSSVHALWDQYYANSPVKLSRFEGPEDIKPPKQGTK